MRGNAEFGHGQWELALGTYREGLGELPPRKKTSLEKGKGKAALEEGTAEVDDTKVEVTAEEEGETESAEDKEISSLRAVLSANVAACLLKLVSTPLRQSATAHGPDVRSNDPSESMERCCKSLR